ncbi:MAG: glutamate--tRNA ligase [Patescibacteria group bacterium]
MIRVRFAPSPTGELHIGSARTALYNYLFAKQNKGQFVLRLEDTDQERYVKGSEKRLLDDLKWLGIEWDEGPDLGGKYQPYIQSERLDLYKKHAEKLLDNSHAYYCFCSVERLAELRKKQQANKQPTKYDRHCLTKSAEEVKKLITEQKSHVLRLKIPDGKTTFVDTIHGTVTVANETIDDQVLLKSDGFPTYHLANVVDDYIMKITDVIRGEEWLPSTAKHVILYKAFTWSEPKWTHLPNVLNDKKAKLSKRRDGEIVWLSTYKKKGYFAEAIVNFLALLGWHPSDNQELFSLSELIKQFKIERVQKAGAIFDLVKLNWFNQQYIRKMAPQNLDQVLKEFYPKSSYQTLRLSQMLQSRLTMLEEASTYALFFFKDKISVSKTMLVPKGRKSEITKKALEQGSEVLGSLKEWRLEAIKTALDQLIKEQEFSRKDLLWPIRVALTGQEKSPDVYEVLVVLGQERSLARLKQAMELF